MIAPPKMIEDDPTSADQVLTIAGDIKQQIYVKSIRKPPLTMISKCANPQCSKALMRMDGGRFFGFPTKNKTIEHFWLCGNCSKHFTLRQVEGEVELQQRTRKTA